MIWPIGDGPHADVRAIAAASVAGPSGMTLGLVRWRNIIFVPASDLSLYCTIGPARRPRNQGNKASQIGNVGRRFLFCARPARLNRIRRASHPPETSSARGSPPGELPSRTPTSSRAFGAVPWRRRKVPSPRRSGQQPLPRLRFRGQRKQNPRHRCDLAFSMRPVQCRLSNGENPADIAVAKPLATE